MKSARASLIAAAFAALIMPLAACPGGASVPGGGPGIPGRGSSSVDPNTCGNYAATEVGGKLKAFLESTVTLNEAVLSAEASVQSSCVRMGEELGLDGLDGDTRTVCNRVAATLQEHLQVGLQANAELNVQYQPAVCEVNVEAAADVAAKCEGSASADVAVSCEGVCEGTCEGTCQGTCQGACDGTCSAKGPNGQCNGQCSGQCEGTCSAGCQGTCSGSCQGHADVQADASCEAKAEVAANVDARCTKPELDVGFEASMVADRAKLDQAIAAIKAGLPELLMIKAKIEGPIMAAFTTWARASKELAGSANKLAGSLGDQALCVGGQLTAAAGMLAQIQASIDVQVEVSASVSASASAGGDASAG